MSRVNPTRQTGRRALQVQGERRPAAAFRRSSAT